MLKQLVAKIKATFTPRPKCDWGPRPKTLFSTTDAKRFDFKYHGDQADGHSVVTAPTGSGMTSLMTYLQFTDRPEVKKVLSVCIALAALTISILPSVAAAGAPCILDMAISSQIDGYTKCTIKNVDVQLMCQTQTSRAHGRSDMTIKCFRAELAGMSADFRFGVLAMEPAVVKKAEPSPEIVDSETVNLAPVLAPVITIDRGTTITLRPEWVKD